MEALAADPAEFAANSVKPGGASPRVAQPCDARPVVGPRTRGLRPLAIDFAAAAGEPAQIRADFGPRQAKFLACGNPLASRNSIRNAFNINVL